MKIVFFGTPEYVLPILTAIHKTFKDRGGKSPVVAVVTQPPKPIGRKKFLTYSPVDTWAHKREIPKFYKSTDLLKESIKADLGILAAYGEIIPKEVIDIFPNGILNIHPSLLPKYRGASPVQAAILSEEKETGVTIIKIDEKPDHGLIVSQFREETLESDTSGTLRKRLFQRSAEVLTSLIPAYLEGKIKLKEQNHDEATFTRLIKKDHGFIPPKYFATTLQGGTLKGKWEIPFMRDYSIVPSPSFLERFIRAMDPWPGAWTNIKIKDQNSKIKIMRLKILKAHLEKEPVTSNLLLVPDTVQLEGKNPFTWKQFIDTYNVL